MKKLIIRVLDLYGSLLSTVSKNWIAIRVDFVVMFLVIVRVIIIVRVRVIDTIVILVIVTKKVMVIDSLRFIAGVKSKSISTVRKNLV